MRQHTNQLWLALKTPQVTFGVTYVPADVALLLCLYLWQQRSQVTQALQLSKIVCCGEVLVCNASLGCITLPPTTSYKTCKALQLH